MSVQYKEIEPYSRSSNNWQLFEGWDPFVYKKSILYYHLDEQVVPSLTDTDILNLESQHYDLQIQVCKEPLTEAVRPVVKADSWSPSYGVLKQTNRIEYRFSFDNECLITKKKKKKKKQR